MSKPLDKKSEKFVKKSKKANKENTSTAAMPARSALAKPKGSSKRPIVNEDIGKVAKKRKETQIQVSSSPNRAGSNATGEKFYAIKSIRNFNDVCHDDVNKTVKKKSVIVARKSLPKSVDDEPTSHIQDR